MGVGVGVGVGVGNAVYYVLAHATGKLKLAQLISKVTDSLVNFLLLQKFLFSAAIGTAFSTDHLECCHFILISPH